ncbi:MAG TPA: hypothetical protein VHZ50_12625 [Puia sp.]|jgi:hypothetical protein|nr:hypothetical protein [Puia sp.]
MINDDSKFICFFDILGFKDIVLNNSHLELNKIYENLFEASSRDVISRWQNVTHTFAYAEDLIELSIISDSIILWSKDLTQKSFLQLLLFARKLLQNAFYIGMPLRGALSVGPITARNTTIGSFTIYGKGLVNAYLLEQSQNWSGCIVDDKAIAKLIELTKNKSGANLNDLEKAGFIVNYSVSLKDNTSKQFYVVNWVRMFNKEFNEFQIRNSFSLLKKNVTDKTQPIINNTIEFFKKINSNM